MPGQKLEGAGTGLADNLADAGGKVGRVPLVGDELTAPFEQAADAARSLAEAGRDQQELVGNLALALAVARCWSFPLGLVLLRLAAAAGALDPPGRRRPRRCAPAGRPGPAGAARAGHPAAAPAGRASTRTWPRPGARRRRRRRAGRAGAAPLGLAATAEPAPLSACALPGRPDA